MYEGKTSEFNGVSFIFLWNKLYLLQASNLWVEEDFHLSHQGTATVLFGTRQTYWTHAVPENWMKQLLLPIITEVPIFFLVHDVCHTGGYLLLLSDLFTNILDGLSEICLPSCWLHFSDEPLMLFEPLAFVIPPSIPRLEKQTPYTCPCQWSHHCTARTKACSYTSGTNHIVPPQWASLGGSGRRWC